MPVEVKIHDNSSGPVRVRPHDKSRPVHVDGEIDEKRLELLIETKEDRIQYISIDSDTGTFDEKTLNSLTSNRLNKLVYKGVYYTLGLKVDDCWKYVCQTTDDPSVKNTITVNTSTGDWSCSSVPSAELQEHINDTAHHIQEGEREFWNNKINCEAHDELLEFNRN